MNLHEPLISQLKPYKEIFLDDKNKLKFFINKHSTQEGTWGCLELIEGEIAFVFLNGNLNELSRYTLNQDTSSFWIPPASWHKIIPMSSTFKLTLRFYCQPHRYFEKKYGLAPIHHDLWHIYQTYFEHQNKLSILDVGCGMGRNPLFFALSEHQVTGIDINTSSIQNIRDIAQQEQLINMETLVHDLNQPLPLLNKPFQFIYSTVVLQFLNKQRVPFLLNELQELTTPKGIHFLVFPIKTEPFSYPKSFTYLAEKNELYHFYQDSGWSVLEYREKPGLLHKLDESGKPMQGMFGLLLAQKTP
ncbi:MULTISPECIES: SAM-dependent methyltransferase TehB [Legionella]|nr:SAM-dependent methyltransferase TehB [Legionella maceachernii]SJZ54471.1 tellurite methyltransferase [Legionella maceachernii]SUP00351.1 Tellurite resistance protein TehB homolog [Legionella maceachernii]